jgi:hypothetical protein
MCGWARTDSRQRTDIAFGLRFGGIIIWAAVSCFAMAEGAVGQTVCCGESKAERPILLDIPAQPLASALEAYSAAAGVEAFYDSNLAAERRSTAVKGILAPDVALRILLEGTGLTVVYATNTFTIIPVASTPQGDGSRLASHEPFLAIVQREVERAFCRRWETVPGQYRLALRFSIGPSGEVLYPRFLGSTGDRQRDDLIADLLGGLSVEQPPPRGLPQPITMIISPRQPAQTGDCGSADGRAPPKTVR